MHHTADHQGPRQSSPTTGSVLRLDEGETPESVDVPAGKVIVPLAVWQAQREALAARAPRHRRVAGVRRAAPKRSRTTCGKFAVIAVDFPKFTDGRGYSIAYNLRKRLGYTGELRAIGDVLRDQLFSDAARAASTPTPRAPDRSIDDALKGLTDLLRNLPGLGRPDRCRCSAATSATCRRSTATSAPASDSEKHHERPARPASPTPAPPWRASRATFRPPCSPPAWRPKTWC